MFPKAGGEYAYTMAVFGPLPAFLMYDTIRFVINVSEGWRGVRLHDGRAWTAACLPSSSMYDTIRFDVNIQYSGHRLPYLFLVLTLIKIFQLARFVILPRIPLSLVQTYSSGFWVCLFSILFSLSILHISSQYVCSLYSIDECPYFCLVSRLCLVTSVVAGVIQAAFSFECFTMLIFALHLTSLVADVWV